MCECVHKGPQHLLPVVHLFTKSCVHGNAKQWVPLKELALLSLSFICQIILFPLTLVSCESGSTAQQKNFFIPLQMHFSYLFLWQCASALTRTRHVLPQWRYRSTLCGFLGRRFNQDKTCVSPLVGLLTPLARRLRPLVLKTLVGFVLSAFICMGGIRESSLAAYRWNNFIILSQFTSSGEWEGQPNKRTSVQKWETEDETRQGGMDCLQQFSQCPACKKEYNVALILPCAHNLCGHCVAAGEGAVPRRHGSRSPLQPVCSVLCPCCRHHVELPCWTWSSATSCLPKHPTLNSACDNTHTDNKSPEVSHDTKQLFT